MCRHLAYLGPPKSLRELLLDPPHGLYRQSWAPRRQRHGTVNADGFGVGWYAAGDPVPARYRRDIPIWNDPSLPDIARVTRSGAVLAAVRSATPGTAQGAAAAAPFGAGTWLFSHNGVLRDWQAWRPPSVPQGNGDGPLGLPPVDLTSLEALTDSALLWALVLRRLRAGASAGVALAAVVAEVEAAGGSGRFNFLLTDGRSVAATAAGDTLCYRRAAGGGVIVASEPSDDEPGWADVPDRHLLTVFPQPTSPGRPPGLPQPTSPGRPPGLPQPTSPGRPPGGPDGITVRPLAEVTAPLTDEYHPHHRTKETRVR